MGGNAFPNHNTCRLNADDFRSFTCETIDKLNRALFNNETRFIDILSYSDKPSHGDLDILYCPVDGNVDTASPDQIGQVLGAVATKRNGTVTSYAVPLGDSFFQIDLIRCPNTEVFKSSYCYFAYNDLGNLLGRIFHYAGFKLGHRGLRYVVRDPDHETRQVKEICVTGDWYEALKFAGYDTTRWNAGFDAIEDIFQYAVSIPLSNQDIFSLEKASHATRVRDRKRATYSQFLKWVKNPKNNVPEKEVVSKNDLRKQWLARAKDEFPQFETDLENALHDLSIGKVIKNKFNGNIVHDLTGLEGKALGKFMTQFREYLGVNKTAWMLETSETDIAKTIVDFFNKKSTN
jgi:hypothetical protein